MANTTPLYGAKVSMTYKQVKSRVFYVLFSVNENMSYLTRYSHAVLLIFLRKHISSTCQRVFCFPFMQLCCLSLLCQLLTLFTLSVTELGGPLSRRKAARRWKAGMHTCLLVQSLDDVRVYIWVCWSTRLLSRTDARSFVKTTWYSTIVDFRQMSPMFFIFSSCSYFCVDRWILQCSLKSSQILQADSTEFKVQVSQ